VKKHSLFLLLIVFLVNSCAQPTPVPTPLPTATLTPRPTLIVPPTMTPIILPTPTPTPISDPSTWTKEQALANHESERLAYLREQGAAQSIPALEYHGDDYRMTIGGGVIELDPEGFESQMAWFHENHVHAVTGEELRQWLNGELELPARSVLLTFDLGAHSSQVSVPRMLDVFRKYQMFGLFTIYHPSNQSEGMDAGSSFYCPDDRCWEAFRIAYNSGYATIGTHTITHRDFAQVDEKEGMAEIEKSKQIIEENIGNGCEIFLLTWPLESVPSWAKNLKSIGIELAFAGYTYPILENAVWKNKPEDFYKLPRILPPNSNGISGRPSNKTLEEIMKMYTTSWE
jgi:peptidoglycan/xylan/chitin deacetylase (PgdA/CDA1 family)